MSTLGERIRKARGWFGISQVELARALGVEQASVSRWENGGEMSISHLRAICHVLNVSADWLLDIDAFHHARHPLTMPPEQHCRDMLAVVSAEDAAPKAGA